MRHACGGDKSGILRGVTHRMARRHRAPHRKVVKVRHCIAALVHHAPHSNLSGSKRLGKKLRRCRCPSSSRDKGREPFRPQAAWRNQRLRGRPVRVCEGRSTSWPCSYVALIPRPDGQPKSLALSAPQRDQEAKAASTTQSNHNAVFPAARRVYLRGQNTTPARPTDVVGHQESRHRHFRKRSGLRRCATVMTLPSSARTRYASRARSMRAYALLPRS